MSSPAPDPVGRVRAIFEAVADDYDQSGGAVLRSVGRRSGQCPGAAAGGAWPGHRLRTGRGDDAAGRPVWTRLKAPFRPWLPPGMLHPKVVGPIWQDMRYTLGRAEDR